SPQEAVRHALAASDVDRAASLMELAMPAIRRHRQEAVLPSWLGALPDHVIRRSPVLSFCFAAMLLAGGDLEAVEPRLADAERALAVGPDASSPGWAETEELHSLPASIAIYRASLAQARGDVEGTARHAGRALELAGPGDHAARGGAAGFLGLASWAQGDISGALATFGQAVASLHAAGNVVDELSSTVVLADLWLAAGRPQTARRRYEHALQRAEAHGEPVARATADLHVGLSELDHEAGDQEAARRHLEVAAALGRRRPMAESRYRWYVAMARVVGATGDVETALGLLDQAEELYRPGFFPQVRPIAALKARFWVGQGALAQAAAWAREREVSAADEASYLREFDHLTLARLLLAQHRAGQDRDALDRAVVLLGRLRDAAEAADRAGSLLEVGLLQALALAAQGHRQQAVETVSRALTEIPEPGGYARLFLDEGDPMVALLRQVDQGVAQQQARRLLGLLPAGRGDDRSPLTARSSASTLSERELQVLRLLGGELSGPLIARELFVSQNTVRTHTKHIFTKLGVTNRRAAVQRARERGLL
ncbi:MAG TPA: LuxR C-terminal-related transcriptional regulator, partial [Actinomycetales bacterium]